MAAAIIFVPLWFAEFGTLDSFLLALPILTASMSGFVLNDIFDEERDRVNHPTRPIPSGHLSSTTATILYFALLAGTLLTIKLYVPIEQLFMYLTFILLFSNYNFAVEKAPRLKNFYVAITTIIPVWIITDLIGIDRTRFVLIAALVLYIVGRELLMDVQDMDGDGSTLANLLGNRRSVRLAFALQTLAIVSLTAIVGTSPQAFAIGAMFAMLVGFLLMWKRHELRRPIIHGMKLQIALAYTFLII